MEDLKQIYLPVEKKKELMKTFKTNKVTLWSALTFQTDSPKARMLRAAAYERGGVLYPDPKRKVSSVPDCTTIFCTAEKVMIQTFSDKVRLLCNLENGDVNLYVGADLKLTCQNPDLVQLGEIQATAQNLANELSMTKEAH